MEEAFNNTKMTNNGFQDPMGKDAHQGLERFLDKFHQPGVPSHTIITDPEYTVYLWFHNALGSLIKCPYVEGDGYTPRLQSSSVYFDTVNGQFSSTRALKPHGVTGGGENADLPEYCLDLTPFVREVDLPDIAPAGGEKITTLFGETTAGSFSPYASDGSKNITLQLLDTEYCILDAIFYPWMKDINSPWWYRPDKAYSEWATPYPMATLEVTRPRMRRPTSQGQEFDSREPGDYTYYSYRCIGIKPISYSSFEANGAGRSNLLRTLTLICDMCIVDLTNDAHISSSSKNFGIRKGFIFGNSSSQVSDPGNQEQDNDAKDEEKEKSDAEKEMGDNQAEQDANSQDSNQQKEGDQPGEDEPEVDNGNDNSNDQASDSKMDSNEDSSSNNPDDIGGDMEDPPSNEAKQDTMLDNPTPVSTPTQDDISNRDIIEEQVNVDTSSWNPFILAEQELMYSVLDTLNDIGCDIVQDTKTASGWVVDGTNKGMGLDSSSCEQAIAVAIDIPNSSTQVVTQSDGSITKQKVVEQMTLGPASELAATAINSISDVMTTSGNQKSLCSSGSSPAIAFGVTGDSIQDDIGSLGKLFDDGKAINAIDDGLLSSIIGIALQSVEKSNITTFGVVQNSSSSTSTNPSSDSNGVSSSTTTISGTINSGMAFAFPFIGDVSARSASIIGGISSKSWVDSMESELELQTSLRGVIGQNIDALGALRQTNQLTINLTNAQSDILDGVNVVDDISNIILETKGDAMSSLHKLVTRMTNGDGVTPTPIEQYANLILAKTNS